MMYEKAQQEMYSGAAEWLKDHYLAKNNLPAALEMAELIFHKRPWFAEYQKMREISMELGNWEAVRQAALTFLETTKNISTLVEAVLDEGDIERALQLLKATKPSGPDGYQWQYDYARTPEVALEARTGNCWFVRRNAMTDRLKKEEFVRLLAARMKTDEATATAWIDGVVETLYESFKDGKGVTLPGFGGFYVRPEPESWVFKFNPGQRLRALFGWSSTYSGEL